MAKNFSLPHCELAVIWHRNWPFWQVLLRVAEKIIWQIPKKIFHASMNFTSLCTQCTGGCQGCDPFDQCHSSNAVEPFELNMLGKIAAAIRGLVMDMVATARSGHLGMALGCAEIGAVLFGKYLRCDPARPQWVDRDRFVLSAGHGSALLYACLHLSGHAISLEDLTQFRQNNARTTGHPEFNPDCGIECSTGPLGQGVANAVGMALARKKLRAQLGQSAGLLQGKIVCLAGDGCLQEGVALEAIGLAGHWQLEDLILIYDSNGNTLDGSLTRAQSHGPADLFLDQGWGVQEIDGNDLAAIIRAFGQARVANGKPQLILARTLIGKGIRAIEGSSLAHGCEPGLAHIDSARQDLELGAKFQVDPEVCNYLKLIQMSRHQDYETWFYNYENELQKNPDVGLIFMEGQVHGTDLLTRMPAFPADPMATRTAVGQILDNLANYDPCLLSASADLFDSIQNAIGGGGLFSSANPTGRNIEFGVREHSMAAILNGLAYDGTFRPIGSTFLAFANYLYPALRMSALARLPIGFIFSHDSLMVGADGPTHQPVEALPSLRLIPNVHLFRPADAEEAVAAVAHWVDRRDGPTVLIVSRQPLPLLSCLPSDGRRRGAARGAYVLLHEKDELKLILLATGSEVSLCCQVSQNFPSCRVVSMPCKELFELQEADYRREVLPLGRDGILVVEAARAAGWERYGSEVLSVEGFGQSMDGKQLMAAHGFSPESLGARVRARLSGSDSRE